METSKGKTEGLTMAGILRQWAGVEEQAKVPRDENRHPLYHAMRKYAKETSPGKTEGLTQEESEERRG